MIVVDQRKKKYDPRRLRHETVSPFIVVHVTDVTRGFGPDRIYERAMQSCIKDKGYAQCEAPRLTYAGEPYDAAVEDLVTDFGIVGAARRLAIWHRYEGIPYHWIASRDTIIQNDCVQLRSAHAGPHGNDGVGVAVDIGRAEIMSSVQLSVAKTTLAMAIEDLFRLLDVPIRVTAHRNFSEDRGPDPGPHVWRDAVIPVVARFSDRALIDPAFAHGDGRPIPESWG